MCIITPWLTSAHFCIFLHTFNLHYVVYNNVQFFTFLYDMWFVSLHMSLSFSLSLLIGYRLFTVWKITFIRQKSGVHRNLVVALNVQWTSFTAISEFQMTTTEHGFSLKSGFKKIWWPRNMVLVLNLDSRRYCLHTI